MNKIEQSLSIKAYMPDDNKKIANPINELFNIRGSSCLADAIERFNELNQMIMNIVIMKSLYNWDDLYHKPSIKKAVGQFLDNFGSSE